jgi:hypothetical protein
MILFCKYPSRFGEVVGFCTAYLFPRNKIIQSIFNVHKISLILFECTFVTESKQKIEKDGSSAADGCRQYKER